MNWTHDIFGTGRDGARRPLRSRRRRDSTDAGGTHWAHSLHPFANGNGRLSRMLADLLTVALGGERFTWGSADLVDAGRVRNRYIAALRQADANAVAPLLAFARS
jgi:hypothetical protein